VILIWLVATAVIVALTLPTLYIGATAASTRARAAISDACAAELAQTPSDAFPARMAELRKRYQLRDLRMGHRISERGDIVEHRRSGAIEISIVFAPDPVKSARQIVLIVVAASLLGSIAGVALLASQAVRSATREQPAPETARIHLVETFETSIRSMKDRQSELQRMRDQEKERADQLETITETLVRSLSSGFLSIDQHGLLVDMNEAARELLRVGDRPIQGRTVMAALGRTPFGLTIQRAIERRESLQREEVGSPTEEMLIGLTTVPLLDEGDRYFGMLALFTNLLPVRKLEQRLRNMQSLADLGEMSAGIAHEFRNSLSTVLGYLNLAKKSGLSPDAAERVARAEHEARQLNAAVESLLAFARPMPLALQPVDLRTIFEDAIDQLRPIATGVAFEISGRCQITGDPLLLQRLAENVLRNAVESIREKGLPGKVIVTVEDTPEHAVIVRDDGLGIENARAASLFLPFQSTKRDGFGLGLALAKKIAVLHDATISLTGTPGSGATLDLRFAPR
jgi:signal transduction histidine kinase